jgi:hypothetical protein
MLWAKIREASVFYMGHLVPGDRKYTKCPIILKRKKPDCWLIVWEVHF